MARKNVQSFIKRAINAIFWLAILCFLAVVSFIIFIITKQVVQNLPVADYDSSKPTKTGDPTYYPAWQEPFEYEVAVYATTESFLQTNMSQFFENAQLLWHIPPHSLEKRYPLFKKKTTVKVPDSVVQDKGMEKSLFAHVFMQRAGQLSPHPNTTDPNLVYLRSELAWWVNPQLERMRPENDTADVLHKLVAATRIPWATVLENNRYMVSRLPPRIAYQTFYNFLQMPAIGTFLPMLAINQYTVNPRDFMPTTVMLSNETANVAGDFSIDIEMEIQGISELAVTMKEHYLQVVDERRETLFHSLQLSELLVAKECQKPPGQGTVNDQCSKPLTIGEKNSVPTLLAAAFLMFFFVIGVFYTTKLTAEFWISPRSKLIGVSRSIAAVGVVDWLLRLLYTWIEGDIMTTDNALSLLTTWGYVAVMYNPFSDKETAANTDGSQNVSTDKPGDKDAENEDPQQEPLVEKPVDVAQSAEQAEKIRIIEIRKSVDASILRLACKCLVPALAVVAAYAYRENEYRWDSRDFILQIISALIYLTTWFYWIPQIALNHCARSGSLVPVSISVFFLCQHLLSHLLTMILGGYEGGRELDATSVIENACELVMIIQWAWFANKKNKSKSSSISN